MLDWATLKPGKGVEARRRKRCEQQIKNKQELFVKKKRDRPEVRTEERERQLERVRGASSTLQRERP